jgi:hypothetical protein
MPAGRRLNLPNQFTQKRLTWLTLQHPREIQKLRRCPPGLTEGPDSRKLKDCEGCGSSCILNRIIFPETGQASTPLTAGLRIKEKQWQTMYRR